MDPAFYENFWNTIKNKKMPFKGTFVNKRKDGTKYYAQTTVSPIMDKQGNVQFFVGIERDITKEIEIDKMKDEFITLVSHQLRTPLSAIKWYLEMLVDGIVGTLTKEQEKHAKEIYETNQQMINLVNTLLSTSRIESGKIVVDPKPTDIEKIVRDVISEVEINAKNKKQKVELEVEENLPEINLDPRLIRNVYLNLITNALFYSPEETTIQINIYKDAENLISKVKDEGQGIPEKEQNKIFNKFFRGEEAKKLVPSGTGLGLYLSKAIIDSSGGDIWFESDKEGTTFWFTVPLKGMKAQKPTQKMA
jgi:signal transduction histidine kinase